MANKQLQQLIRAQASESFTEPAKATDEEALGLLVAHFFEWDGAAILRTFQSALEDANFHEEASQVWGMLKAVETIP